MLAKKDVIIIVKKSLILIITVVGAHKAILLHKCSNTLTNEKKKNV